jgi:hypothetical protein
MQLKPIDIKSGEDTPSVILDQERNRFEISGKSFPEDPTEFFTPILQWLEKYIEEPNPFTLFEIKIYYFNSASAKQFLKIFSLLIKISSPYAINIIWYYEPDDSTMRVKGEAYRNMLPVSFELKEMVFS